ncbi:hypothetical protein RchiOBHm_Chr1g0325571 [Rosa chinensis]|uniref:Uncharacterized protein n=1 Tax=Rosa chinensis TaxID=74649 RepID=A0A2P6SA04_ROSCH|nr:uncharacterized protein LOC121049211 isoform X2 [Rosa chinensis]PRQ55528.1 hypothetical protein RchiOBHm_Chr1g0325571 [Rosa chinensis]
MAPLGWSGLPAISATRPTRSLSPAVISKTILNYDASFESQILMTITMMIGNSKLQNQRTRLATRIPSMMEGQIQESLFVGLRLRYNFSLVQKHILPAETRAFFFSMDILKDFITKHNFPNDVPDELVEDCSNWIIVDPLVI